MNNLPSTVGGGGFHADGKLPRFRAVDFKPLSELGPIEGADIVDWPVDYDEMEPYYAEAERLIGVAGDADGNPFAEWRSGPYPMPPGADMFGAVLTTEAATRLGYHPYRAPTGVNSVPYDGRPACNNCGFCAFYGCPIEAKGDPIAPLRNALRTGRCEIRVDSYVERVLLDASGQARRAACATIDIDGNAHEVSGRVVVVAGGAWETPRLLLRSEIANSSDLVGRYLMYHFQTFVIGQFPFRLHGHRGRSVTHLHDDHMIIDDDVRAFAREHGLPYFRGGLTEHGGGGSPVMEGIYTAPGITHTPRDARLEDARQAVGVHRAGRRPPADRRTASTSIRRCATCYGFPAGRATYDVHPHEVVASRYYAPQLEADHARGRRGAHVRGDLPSPRRRPGRYAAARRCRVTSWARAGWATTPPRASSIRGSASTTSRT